MEQCRVKKIAQGFNTAAQDSNLGPYSRELKALPLSHCVLHTYGRTLVKCSTSPNQLPMPKHEDPGTTLPINKTGFTEGVRNGMKDNK